MCEICRQSPCHNMCPNATPPKVIGRCDQCDCELTEDCTFFTDNASNMFCSKECALAFYGVTEEEYNGE